MEWGGFVAIRCILLYPNDVEVKACVDADKDTSPYLYLQCN